MNDSVIFRTSDIIILTYPNINAMRGDTNARVLVFTKTKCFNTHANKVLGGDIETALSVRLLSIFPLSFFVSM